MLAVLTAMKPALVAPSEPEPPAMLEQEPAETGA